MLRSQTLAPLWDTSVELGKMSYRVRMVSKYQVDTVFICVTAVVTIAMLTDSYFYTAFVGIIEEKIGCDSK
jgi:hypothetical protein